MAGVPTARGATLIELIVVLSILGLAIVLASPSFLKGTDRFALDSTGHQLVTAFRTARNEARLGQRELLATFSGNEFVLLGGDSRTTRIQLSKSVELPSMKEQIKYSFLASGQILGPERLELVAGAYRGVLILGPPPGTVRFEMSGANASPVGRSHQEMEGR